MSNVINMVPLRERQLSEDFMKRWRALQQLFKDIKEQENGRTDSKAD